MSSDGILAPIDAAIVATQQKLAQLLDTRRRVAEVLGISLPAPALDEALEVRDATAIARRATARRVTIRRTRAVPGSKSANGRKASDVDERLLGWLQRQKHPVRPGDVAEALNVDGAVVSRAVKRLEAAKTVVRTGKTFGTRIGVPSVMRKASKEEL